MKTMDMRKPENYVSPEIEIIELTIQSGILDGSPSGEQIGECTEHSGSWCTSDQCSTEQ